MYFLVQENSADLT